MEQERTSSAEPQEPTRIKKATERFLKFLRRPKRVRYSTIREARQAVIDLFIHLIFLGLATFVTQTTCDYKMYFYTDMLDKQLATRKTVIEPGLVSTFEGLYSVPQFWDFVEYTFLPLLDKGDFKKNDPSSIYESTDETQQFAQIYGDIRNRTLRHGNVLIGPPRLRQIRVKSGLCVHHPIFSRHLKECYSPYGWMKEDRLVHQGVRWESMFATGYTPLAGEIEIYLGAGYIVSLSYDNERNLELIKQLKEAHWIDQGSRAFVLEFNLYHVDTRLFELAKFMVENPSTGTCVPIVKLRTLRRESLFSKPLWVVLTLAYLIFIMLSTAKEMMLIKKLGFCSYLGVLINFTDFLCCLLSYIMIILNIVQFFLLKKVVNHIRRSDEFINLDISWNINIVYNNICGFIIFIAWIRLLHFVVFNRTMLIFVRVVHASKQEMTGFLLLFFTVFMAYSQCGMALFGGNDPEFRNMLTSTLTMVRWTVGNSQYEELPKTNLLVTRIYYISFVILVFIILLFAFQAIINNTYDEVKQVALTRPSKLGTVIKLFFRLLYDLLYFVICGKRKRRPPIDVDAKDELESDGRVDPRQAAAMAAMRHIQSQHPTTLSQADYLPGRLERAAKRIQVLEEVTEPALNRLRAYYRLLSKPKGTRTAADFAETEED